MIYGCSQPRELWFIDFNHVYKYTDVHCTCVLHVYTCTCTLCIHVHVAIIFER